MPKTVESMSHGAFAIVHDEDHGVVFIENACPGDSVEYEVYDKRKAFAYADLTEIISPGELREEHPPCKIHKICGSCQWQHIKYEEQLKFKRQNLVDLLEQNKIEIDKVPDLLGMDEPWHYRNKIIYPVDTVPSTGRLLAGYFKRNSNELINIKYCPIQYSIFDEIMERAKDLCSEHGIGKGLLRHILMRSNQDQSEILVSFIIRRTHPEKESTLAAILKQLESEFPAIVSTTINFNDYSTNVILGDETKVISGPGHIVESFGEIKLEISTTSFFQVNNEQFLKIIDIVKEETTDAKKILDAYCGIGTISLSIARDDLEITGIELVADAINNAENNAKLNGISRTNFVAGQVEDHLDKFQSDYDAIIINPPRKGCTNKVLDAIGASNSPKLIYVSCNPATLTRDIKYLEQYGYKLDKVQPVDMFPHSFHFETVAILKSCP